MIQKKKFANLITIFFTASIAMFLGTNYTFASSSTDFELDYDGITTGSQRSTSSGFVMQSGTLPFETNSSSTDFQVVTVNLIPETAVCGNGTIDIGETCDTANFGGQTCATYGFNSGNLACITSCTVIDSSGCFNYTPPSGGESGGGGGPMYFPPQPETEEEPSQEELTIEPEEPPESEEPPPEEPTIEPDFSFIRELLLPSAEPEDKEEIIEQLKYHLENYEEKEIIKTSDKTPLVIDQLDPDADYTISIINENGEKISEEKIQANLYGEFIYEPEVILPDGKYIVVVTDKKGMAIKDYIFEIKENGYQELEIVTFAKIKDIITDFDKKINLGNIEKLPDQSIEGIGEPNSRIYAYFLTDILTEETKTDYNGYFSIPIPQELTIGNHTVKFVQIYPDKTISKSLTYYFKLVSPEELKEVGPEIAGKQYNPFLYLLIYLILVSVAATFVYKKDEILKK